MSHLSRPSNAASFAIVVLALIASGHAAAGPRSDLVPAPAKADAASVSRGDSAPRGAYAWHHERQADRVVSSGLAKLSATRDARCDVRDTCTAGAIGAVAPAQPAMQAEGDRASTYLR